MELIVHSARNIDVEVGGSHVDEALHDVVETHTVHRRGGKKVEHAHTVSEPVVSEFVAENGHIGERVQGPITLQAPHVLSRDGTSLESRTGIFVTEAHRVETHTTQVTERGGPLRKDHRSLETIQTGTSVGALFEGPTRLLAPKTDLTNVTAVGLLEIDADDTTFRPGTRILKHARQEHRRDLVWTKGYSNGSESLTYDPLSLANIRVNRGNVVVEYGARQNFDLLRSQVGEQAQFIRLYDQHSSYYDDYSTPGALTSGLVTLAVDSFLPGFGSSVWAAMGHAATSAALSQGILTQRINPTDLMIAASTAGVLHKLTSSIPYLERASNAKVRTFGQHAAYHMTRAMVPSVVNVAFGRDVSWDDVMRMGVVSTVGAWGANEIGGRYLDKNTHYWGHKALHYGLGFGMGVALNPKDWVKAGIAGGTAAVVSEVMAEATEMTFLSKAIGTIAGSLIIEGADPMAAMLIARNAVENNFEYSKMMELFEDRTGLSDLGETWEDRVEQERLVQGAYTGFRSSLVGKAEGVAGTPGKVAVDFLMPSHHNLIVPELMMNISGAAAGVKFVIKAPKYAPNLLRMAPKAFDVTKGFLRNFISPRQLVKTLPKKDAAQMIAKRNVKGRLTSVSHTQKHHIIHQSLKDHELIQLANFNIHNPANIMLLPTKTGAKLTTTSRAVHQGRHTDEVVRALRISMNKVAEVGKAVGYKQEQYKQALLRIIAGERLELKMGLKSL